MILTGKLKLKIVNLAMEQIKKHPNYHDKIEFKVMPNSYFFDFKKKVKNIIPSLN